MIHVTLYTWYKVLILKINTVALHEILNNNFGFKNQALRLTKIMNNKCAILDTTLGKFTMLDTYGRPTITRKNFCKTAKRLNNLFRVATRKDNQVVDLPFPFQKLIYFSF